MSLRTPTRVQIERFLARTPEKAFIRSEFNRFGSPSAGGARPARTRESGASGAYRLRGLRAGPGRGARSGSGCRSRGSSAEFTHGFC